MSIKNHFLTQPVAWTAFVISLSLLGGAHAFEYFGGLPPCPLCLTQRTAHWVVVGIAGMALITGRRHSRTSLLFLAALLLAYLTSTGIAGYHTGVEWRWWAGPATCTSGQIGTTSAEDLLAALQQPAEMPACDKIPWALFGLSMAGYNALISLGMALLCGLALVGKPKFLRGRGRMIFHG